jgi:glycosyltransferase involved in cell wall biosynthesis
VNQSRAALWMQSRPALWMLLTRLADGGAERLTVELACRLPARGYRVTVCTTRHHDERAPFQATQASRLAAAGVEFVSIGRRHRLDSLKLGRLRGMLRSDRVDILHTHLFHSNLWGTILGGLAGVPVIVAHEHGWSYERSYRRLLDRLVIGRLASAFVVGSEWNRHQMLSLERVPPEKCVLIPNAFFPRPQSGGDLRRELGLHGDALLIGTVAKLRAEKALDVLLEAFAQVRPERPDARLVIAGDGDLRSGLEQCAREMGVSEATTFLGRREDVQAIVNALDVTVICSDFESTSLFALEAMSYGAALVCTEVGGLRELLTDGISALLVPPRAPGELAGAILRLARDAGLRRRLRDAAALRAGEFSAATLVTRYDELYRSLLARAGPRRRADRMGR